MKEYIKRILQFLFPTIALLLLVLLLINYWVLSFSKKGYFFEIENLPQVEVWLVFWASVKKNLEPSDILKDRLQVAADAYKNKKIQKIIVSGDNSHSDYNEPVAMEQYLTMHWVEANDIYLDYAWFDTFDSIYRAKHVFSTEELILFTQWFHLQRAMYIGKRLWLKVYWIQTDLHRYMNESYNMRREVLARVKAFLDIEINRSKPKFLWPLVDMKKPQEKE